MGPHFLHHTTQIIFSRCSTDIYPPGGALELWEPVTFCNTNFITLIHSSRQSHWTLGKRFWNILANEIKKQEPVIVKSKEGIKAEEPVLNMPEYWICLFPESSSVHPRRRYCYSIPGLWTPVKNRSLWKHLLYVQHPVRVSNLWCWLISSVLFDCSAGESHHMSFLSSNSGHLIGLSRSSAALWKSGHSATCNDQDAHQKKNWSHSQASVSEGCVIIFKRIIPRFIVSRWDIVLMCRIILLGLRYNHSDGRSCIQTSGTTGVSWGGWGVCSQRCWGAVVIYRRAFCIVTFRRWCCWRGHQSPVFW